MVYCFAYGCNTDSRSGKSTFAFPSRANKALRAQWIQAINRSKKDVDSAKTPRLCQDHFRQDSFNKLPEIAKSIGCSLLLKKDIVPDPSLFERKNEPTSKSKERKSLAFQKRQNIQVCLPITSNIR